MKRFLSILLILSLCLTFIISTSAAGTSPESAENLGDGFYCISEIRIIENSTTRAVTKTVTAEKTTTVYTSYGAPIYNVTVVGTFSYDGTTSKVLSVSMRHEIFDSSWSLNYDYTYFNGSTAYAVASFSYNTTQTRRVEVGLTCSPTGVLT